MKIKELRLKNFGKFTNKEIHFFLSIYMKDKLFF